MGLETHLNDAAISPIPTSLGPDFLKRTMIGAAVTGVFLTLGILVRWAAPEAMGFALGLAWGLLNFWLLGMLLRAMTQPEKRGQAPLLTLLKFGVYGLGVALLFWNVVPLLFLVAGFSWLLAVVILRAMGAMAMGGQKSGVASAKKDPHAA